LTVAGAFAFNNIKQADTRAAVAGNAVVASDGGVAVKASHAGDIEATADAGATRGGVGFGIAVAVNKGAIHRASAPRR
jgi:hypothetical protein